MRVLAGCSCVVPASGYCGPYMVTVGRNTHCTYVGADTCRMCMYISLSLQATAYRGTRRVCVYMCAMYCSSIGNYLPTTPVARTALSPSSGRVPQEKPMAHALGLNVVRCPDKPLHGLLQGFPGGSFCWLSPGLRLLSPLHPHSPAGPTNPCARPPTPWGLGWDRQLADGSPVICCNSSSQEARTLRHRAKKMCPSQPSRSPICVRFEVLGPPTQQQPPWMQCCCFATAEVPSILSPFIFFCTRHDCCSTCIWVRLQAATLFRLNSVAG